MFYFLPTDEYLLFYPYNAQHLQQEWDEQYMKEKLVLLPDTVVIKGLQYAMTLMRGSSIWECCLPNENSGS